MFTHYLKIAFRNLWKYKTQSLIGIFGLAFGIACFVPALYWMRYETTYDSFYPNAAHIYRIYSVEKQSGKVNEQVPGILEKVLHNRFPTTELSAAFEISQENYKTRETPHIRLRTLYADSTFFRVFPQVFISGDARQPLRTIRNIILTESVAVHLFGDAEKAIGQQVHSTLYFFPPYTVTAVVKDPPPNTNLPFDVIHFPEIQIGMTDYMPEEAQWKYFNKQLYIKLNPQTDAGKLAEQLRDFPSQLGTNDKIELHILPVGDIRYQLDTNLPFTLNFIRLLVAAGLLLLLSAFFNFLNLNFGLFRQRIRELRLRATHGASQVGLVQQLTFELAFMVLIALLFALCLIVLCRPLFAELLGFMIETPRLMRLFAGCGLAVFILMLSAGLVPLWHLCRSALRDLSKGRPALRHPAVALQLAVSMVFIVASLVVMLQLRYVNNKDLGFDRSGVVQMTTTGWPGPDKWNAIINQLSAIPQIEGFTDTYFEPQHTDHAMVTEVEWPGKLSGEKPSFQSVAVDSRFSDIFKLKMTQGRWWNEDDKKKIVLNEEAVRVMGLEDPVGSIIRMLPDFVMSTGENPMEEYEVTGVVNDFHTLSLRSPVQPTLFRISDLMIGGTLYIRIIPGREQEVMNRIAGLLPDIDPSLADARLTLLDDLYDRLNRPEQAGVKIFSMLATVCLLITLFGIYAVSTVATLRRRKEIAIRKVSGAEASDIISMFFREYIVMVVIAGVAAISLAYPAMIRWLQGYAYHTNIPWWLLAGVIVVVVVLVLLTVLGQVLKAANSNPADVVKSE